MAVLKVKNRDGTWDFVRVVDVDLEVDIASIQEELNNYINGSNIRVTNYGDPELKPEVYYNSGKRTIWENWACATLGLITQATEIWAPVLTIVPYHLAEDRLIQIAYTVEGTYIRYSVGTEVSTATWGGWYKFATTLDMSLTIISTSWNGSVAPFTTTINVPGVLSSDTPIIGPVLDDNISIATVQQENYNKISRAVTGVNNITFTCYEDKPSVNIPIQIKVVR